MFWDQENTKIPLRIMSALFTFHYSFQFVHRALGLQINVVSVDVEAVVL